MYVIGLDVGGTKIEGILAKASSQNSLPRIIKRIRIPTVSRNPVISNMASLIAELNDHGRKSIRGFRLRGIGLGTAGFLKNGRMEMVPNIPSLKGARLLSDLRKQLRKFGIRAPVSVENDSICFALAEFMFGSAKGYRDVVGIIVGTGIGSGLILGGKIYRGRDGGAGHIGHATIDPSGPKCGCGQRGHFESWCSGKYITQRYLAARGKIKDASPATIFAAAEKGTDIIAKKIMEETYDKFGIALANIINTFNPEIIVLGGGVSNLPGKFYREISVAARKRAYPAFSEKVRIVKNSLGDSAGVVGAAALAFRG